MPARAVRCEREQHLHRRRADWRKCLASQRVGRITTARHEAMRHVTGPANESSAAISLGDRMPELGRQCGYAATGYGRSGGVLAG